MAPQPSLLDEIRAAVLVRPRKDCEIRNLLTHYQKTGQVQNAEDLATALLDMTLAGAAIERALAKRGDLKMPTGVDQVGLRVSYHRRNRCACRRLDK